jgi:protein phosphatase
MFENLPLAALINDTKNNTRVFCCHGGIGSSAISLNDIERIQRPIVIQHTESTSSDNAIVLDLLWSDPTDTEEEMGVIPNLARDPQQKC